MMNDDRDFEGLKRFAALSGVFSPVSALRALDPRNRAPGAMAEIASRLASLCEIRKSGVAQQWILRRSERQWILSDLQKEKALASAMGVRQTQEAFDEEAQDLQVALNGDEAFSILALENFAQGLETSDQLEPDRLKSVERVATTLERLGDLAPGATLLPRFYGILNRNADQMRRNAILTTRFSGREDEIQTIIDWINVPRSPSPTQCLLVRGLPGIGKSALLEAACRKIGDMGRNLVVVRLDFDRPSLDVLDPAGLTLELARQVAIQIPERAAELKSQRMVMASRERIKGRRETLFDMQESRLIGLLEDTVSSANATLLLVIDTLEALRGRGPTHPLQLFDWIDQLANGVPLNVRVIAAGRGEPFQRAADGSASSRVGKELDLSALLKEEVDEVLAKSQISQNLWAPIRDQAKGNPMMLRIVSEMARHSPASLTNGAAGGNRAFLNRWLYGRVQNASLRKMAEHGLFVREITLDAIVTLWPKLAKIAAPTKAQAELVLAELEDMDWLFRKSADDNGLRMRPEFRQILISHYYTTFKRSAWRADRVSAAWFRGRRTSESDVDALYHGLQAMRGGDRPPIFDAETVFRLEEQAISELPVHAQDLLRGARQERSASSRVDGGGDPNAIDLNIVMERGDWGEAYDVFRRIGDVSGLDPTEDLAYAARAFQWRTGRWAEALRSLRRHDALVGPDYNRERLRSVEALTHLEMRAEFWPRGFSVRLEEDNSFRSYVTETAIRSIRSEIPFGGLGIALYFSKVNVPIMVLNEINEYWKDPLSGSVPAVGWRRLQDTLPGAFTRADNPFEGARACSTMTPYQEPLLDMPGDKSDQLPIAQIRELISRLGDLPFTLNGSLERLDAKAARLVNPISILRDAGLLAEALGLVSIGDNRNARLIARRAEYWRKLAAGRRPAMAHVADFRLKGWRHNLDATILGRIEELLVQGDPRSAGYACLDAWLSPFGEESARVAIRSGPLGRKISAVARKLLDRPRDPFAIARLLVARSVPSALIAALSIVLHEDPNFST